MHLRYRGVLWPGDSPCAVTTAKQIQLGFLVVSATSSIWTWHYIMISGVKTNTRGHMEGCINNKNYLDRERVLLTGPQPSGPYMMAPPTPWLGSGTLGRKLADNDFSAAIAAAIACSNYVAAQII